MAKNEKAKVDVYTTKEYGQFKKLLGNRDVTPKRINKIIKSINAVGYVTNPIIVNKKMEIIDGQGRFEALKELGLPIQYIVVDNVGIEACLNMNIYQEKWKLLDYVNSYKERGNENYRKLQLLLDTYPLFSLQVVGTALYNNGKIPGENIKNGSLVITEEDYNRAVESLNYICPLIQYAKRTNGKLEPFFQAVIYCSRMKNVDRERLIQKLQENIGIMNNWGDIATAIQSIEEVYNKGLGQKNIVFMYTEYRKMIFNKAGAQLGMSKSAWVDKVLRDGRQR